MLCQVIDLAATDRYEWAVAKASWMLLGMRPRADTVYPFCRAQSRTAWTWSRPDTGGFTTRCDRRGFCGVTRVPCSTYLPSFPAAGRRSPR